MFAPEIPQLSKYEGEVTSDAVAGGVTADLWESNLMLKQSVPFMTQDYFFDTSDHSTQLALRLGVFIESNGNSLMLPQRMLMVLVAGSLGPRMPHYLM